MRTLNQIKKILTREKPFLHEKFKVKTIAIFGSYVRGEQQKGSDLDILVEFGEPIGFFHFLDLEEFLSKKLGVAVDLVSKKALKPAIGKRIIAEMVSL